MIGEILEFPIHGDKDGSLVALEKGADFPFEIEFKCGKTARAALKQIDENGMRCRMRPTAATCFAWGSTTTPRPHRSMRH